MNVIFLDLDGVIDTCYYRSDEQIEEKVKILADIAHTYNCKIVLEAAAKDSIDPDTLETDSEWILQLMNLFNKYDIELIGRTPSIGIHYSEVSSISMWKEYEIMVYLFNHPEIEHFCIIDDNDLRPPRKSDLEKLKEYLVMTEDYLRENPENEGLLISHKEEVGKVLKLENKYKKYAEKHIKKL